MLIEAGVNTLIELMTGKEDVKELSQKSDVSFDSLLDGILNAKDDTLDEQEMSEQTPAVFYQLLPAGYSMDKSFEPVVFIPSLSDEPSLFNVKTETTEPFLSLQAIHEAVFRPSLDAEMFQAEDTAIPSEEGIDSALQQLREVKTNQSPEFYSQAANTTVLEESRSQSPLLFSMAQNRENHAEFRDEIKDDKAFLDLFKQNQTTASQTTQLLKPEPLASDKPIDDDTALAHQDLTASEKDAASFDQLLKSEPGREDASAASGKPQPPFAESMLPSLSSKSFQPRVLAKEAVMTDYQPTIEPKFMVDQSGSKASLRIHQKDIGEITAKIEMHQQSSSVTLIAENAEAKQVLQGQLSQLKAIFSDSNITLTQANVEEQASHQEHSQQGRKQAKPHQPGLENNLIHSPDQKLITGRQRQTLIDTYV